MIELPDDNPSARSWWEGFKVRIDRADRDEFTVYRWGELENGQVSQTFEEGRKRFGPLEDAIDMFRPNPDVVPAPPEWWLQKLRSIGSMAHRPRATVFHSAIDRPLRYPEYQPIAICRAVGFSDVIGTLTTLEQRRENDGFFLQAEITLQPESRDWVETGRTAIRELIAALRSQPFPPFSDHPLCDTVMFEVFQDDYEIAHVELDGREITAMEDGETVNELSIGEVADNYQFKEPT